MMIPVYQSPADAAREFARLWPRTAASTSGGSMSAWVGGTPADTLRLALNGGTDKHVPAAERIMDTLRDAMPASWREAWTMDMAGAFPSVPAFLAGAPDHMMRRVRQQRENHPVKVVVALTSSGGVADALLVKRGVAVLALAMALQAVRGCELYVAGMLGGYSNGKPDVKALGGGVALVRIPSNPLSISEACLALTAGGFGRGVINCLAAHHGSARPIQDNPSEGLSIWTAYGGWPSKFNYDNPAPFMKLLREQLGFEDDAVMIAPARDDDRKDIAADPIAWVRKTLARFLEPEA